MYTGLIAPSPFIAVLILVIILSRGFSKVTDAKNVNKILAVLWAGYIFLLNNAGSHGNANLISSIFQIVFVYWYLQIAERLEDSIWWYLIFLPIGAYILAFLYGLVYVIAGGQ
ncbi:MAG: hypothetical protein A3A83_02965 [Candidatus Doudnabacteria bacterium RIFCSPLOWO2_01_FULL_48_57]|nr:MAG: hypothetical protein A2668_01695 [Candidatus Doudnabacteria bacterium RIFCSPHIGHO2_01_FULL_48_180]OGE97119.1 MAG: hypothetical protein A3A83_02965 [Candidatus Doudnabacteria bacterium RIFCSPLOWO2_01_FULL_48_57]